MTPTPTELEAAVSSLCTAKTNTEAALELGRQELAQLTDPADRFAQHAYVGAIGQALERLDLVLALVTDELPACRVDELTEAEADLEPPACPNVDCVYLAHACPFPGHGWREELDDHAAAELALEQLAADPLADYREPEAASWRKVLREWSA